MGILSIFKKNSLTPINPVQFSASDSVNFFCCVSPAGCAIESSVCGEEEFCADGKIFLMVSYMMEMFTL